VGGGPAGLAAGIALRLRGLDVVVADSLAPPIDKACGEGLMPDAVRHLLQLGVQVGGGSRFNGIHFAHRGAGREVLATGRFPGADGLGVSRVDLHRQLSERAASVGVRVLWGRPVELGEAATGRNRVHVNQARVGGEAFVYRYLVGADGEMSRVRRWAGLERGRLRSRRFGFRRHYRVAPWSGGVEVHWCDVGQAYVTPVAEDEVCIAAVTSMRGLHFDAILDELPYLRRRLDECGVLGRDRGAVTTTRSLRRVVAGNVALVGDASGSADAITGTGLASAFREATLLADALGRDAIAEYQRGHAAILRLPQTMASMLVAMDRRPRWRNRVLGALAGSPQLFARLLAVHIGAESPARFAATQGLELGWRLLGQGGTPGAPFKTAARADCPQVASTIGECAR
jgi:flavin-dependent dehydrogenase